MVRGIVFENGASGMKFASSGITESKSETHPNTHYARHKTLLGSDSNKRPPLLAVHRASFTDLHALSREFMASILSSECWVVGICVSDLLQVIFLTKASGFTSNS